MSDGSLAADLSVGLLIGSGRLGRRLVWVDEGRKRLGSLWSSQSQRLFESWYWHIYYHECPREEFETPKHLYPNKRQASEHECRSQRQEVFGGRDHDEIYSFLKESTPINRDYSECTRLGYSYDC